MFCYWPARLSDLSPWLTGWLVSLYLKARLHGSPTFDLRGWINQSEPCKQFLWTEVINGVDGWTSWRRPTFVQRRWFALGDSPQITHVNKEQVLFIWLLNFVNYFLIMVLKWRDDLTQLVLDFLHNQECLWNVKDVKLINDVERKLAIANLFTRQPRWSLPLKGTVYTVHSGWFNCVDQLGGPV